MGLCAASFAAVTSCSKQSFEDWYRNPSKVEQTSVEKQFTGVIYGFKELIIPTYRNLFVTLRPTVNRYIQTTGWINETNQLTVGAAATDDRWTQYYKGLTQFKELENIYNQQLTEAEKVEKRIFILTSKVLYYDQTQQMVDLFGDIPWSDAGKLNSNKGDYSKSYAKYDTSTDIYKTMINDLKLISDELNAIKLPDNIVRSFKDQDIINNGDLVLWRKYCNALRLRILTRVSASSDFSAQAAAEIKAIVQNQATYPLPLTNSENAQIDIFDATTKISSDGIKDAFEAEGWYANLAGKKMIDEMNTKADPRLPFIFEPGANAKGKFIGLDQSLGGADQNDLAREGTIAIYNRSTYSRSKNFPGILVTATEVNLLLAEYFQKNGDNTAAKQAFETAVKESINLYVSIRGRSNDNTVAAAPTPTNSQITTYLTNLNWDGAANKLNLIATQKWIHLNLVQAIEAWSEIRRFDYPQFSVPVADSDRDKTIPVKFTLPSAERVYNAENYNAAKAQDNQNTKLFWDIK